MTRASPIERYYDALQHMPESGGGGAHQAMLGVANYGRTAGLSRDQVARDLREHAHGTRRVTDGEIGATVDKAYTGAPYVNPRMATPRVTVDGAKLLSLILERGAHSTEADLWEASHVWIDWPPEEDAARVLRLLYAPGERLFIGSRHDAGRGHVLPVSEWIARFERGIAPPEYIIPNPLTGEPGFAKDGKRSFRADACVTAFRFAVVEFDRMPLEQQIQFWAGVKLPVVALIDSGGKSVHGWVRIDAANAEEWTQRVEYKLFDIFGAVGADTSCKNEARLSRMPGHFRAEKGRVQRLLYLNPAGGPVIP